MSHRQDYCPVGNVPCQSMCDTPCKSRKPISNFDAADEFMREPHTDDVFAAYQQGIRFAERNHGIGKAPRPEAPTRQIKIRTYCEDCGKSVSDEPDGIHTCSPQYGKAASQINPDSAAPLQGKEAGV